MRHLVIAAREFAKSRATALHGSWGLLEENAKTTPVGFEPTRGDPIGLAGRRLNHSAKVSSDLGHIMLPDIFAGRPSMPWLSKASALTVHRGSVVPTSLVRSASALVLFLAFNLGGSVCLIRPDSVLFHMVVVRSVAECLHLILSA